MFKVFKEKDHIFSLLIICAFSFCLIGLFSEPFVKVFGGINEIFKSEAGLLTDYIAVGGIGAAFLNAGLAMLLAVMVTKLSGVTFSGINIGVSFIVLGFAFFGKNIINMPPIIIGTYLYSKLKREEFKKNVNIALFATCLSPTVNYIVIHGPFHLYINTLIAVLTGILIGMIVPMVAGLTSKIHEGMLIYNVGFASGILETAAVAILKSLGYEFSALNNVSSGNNRFTGTIMIVLCTVMAIYGILKNGMSDIKRIVKYSGQSPCDYVKEVGLPATLINMGLVGFMCTMYVICVGGEINGPILSGILATIGFAAFGMNFYNIIWTTVGIVLLSFVSVWKLNETGILLAALFSSCISPIAGKYGPLWGIIAGMLHVSIVRNTAFEFGWLNLYNNGYAAGIVCLVILPVINFYNSIRKH